MTKPLEDATLVGRVEYVQPQDGDVVFVLLADGQGVNIEDLDTLRTMTAQAFPRNKVIVCDDEAINVALFRVVDGVTTLVDCVHNVGTSVYAEHLGDHVLNHHICKLCQQEAYTEVEAA